MMEIEVQEEITVLTEMINLNRKIREKMEKEEDKLREILGGDAFIMLFHMNELDLRRTKKKLNNAYIREQDQFYDITHRSYW